MESPFLVHVIALRREAGTTRRERCRGIIDGLGSLSVLVPAGEAVEADVLLSSFPGGIMATGTVVAPWQGECRRCGGVVTGSVKADVREQFVFGSPEDEDEAYPVVDDLLDLEPLARDAVLLELPLAPLCADDCLGLCPRCGTNLNTATCACAAPLDPRWSALNILRDAEGGDVA